MYLRIACAVSLLALAACDQQTASNSGSGTGSESETSGSSGTSVSNTGGSSGAGGSNSSGTSVTATTGGSSDAASKSSASGGSTTQAPASLAAYQGQALNSGPVLLTLKQDSTFELISVSDNKQVQGEYNYNSGSGIISFSNPKGEVSGASFPMQCRVAETTGGIQMMEASSATGADGNAGNGTSGANSGGCNYFRDLTFRK